MAELPQLALPDMPPELLLGSRATRINLYTIGMGASPHPVEEINFGPVYVAFCSCSGNDPRFMTRLTGNLTFAFRLSSFTRTDQYKDHI